MSSASTTAGAGGWLHGRAADLLIGAGLGYVLSVPLLLALGYASAGSRWPMAAVLVFGIFVNAPHYGATLLRTYQEPEDRRRYAFLAFHLTAILGLIYVIATRQVTLASWLVTLYVTWSPWHFSGQNYGLALMFLHRRGVSVPPATKRLFHLSFVLSSVLAMLAIHGTRADLVFAPATVSAPNTPAVVRLGIPATAANVSMAIVAVLYAASLVGVAASLVRRGRLVDLAPAASLVLTQALWFVVPSLIYGWREGRGETLAFAAIWVSTAHSAQYLWITAYYDGRSRSATKTRRFLGKALLAGSLVTVLPGVLFAPHLLGRAPWDAGLAALTFAVVNLHHFVLDGAIWKLRDGRVARALLRGAQADAGGPALPRRSFVRPLVFALGAICITVPFIELYEKEIGIKRATDSARVLRAVERLRWIGRETTRVHVDVGRGFALAGQSEAAIREYQRGIELFPTSRGWLELGELQRRSGNSEAALSAYREALALTPDSPRALVASGTLLLERGDSRDVGVAQLKRALALRPGLADAARVLANAYREAGRTSDAAAVLEAAIADAKDGDRPLLERELALLRRGNPSSS